FLTLAEGDAAQILPGGLYFQDLLISRELETGLGAPLGATTLTIWMEVTVSMLALALLGLPGIPLLRPVMALRGVGSLVPPAAAHPPVEVPPGPGAPPGTERASWAQTG